MEFNARFTACPFCSMRVPSPPKAKPAASRWTETQMRVVQGPGAFLVGRHLGSSSESWIHTHAGGASFEEASLQLGNGYGQATIFEVVAVVNEPWPTTDDIRTLHWDTVTKSAYALARPSIEWPRVLSDRVHLGLLAIAIDANAQTLEALAAKTPVRSFVLRSWGTFDTDSGYPIR